MAENRLSGLAADVLHDGAANVRASGLAADVLHDGAANVRVTTFAVEVLRSITTQVAGGGTVLIVIQQ
jgi:hypothetical protein